MVDKPEVSLFMYRVIRSSSSGGPPPEDDDLITRYINKDTSGLSTIGFSRVKKAKHWGFCSELCVRSVSRARRLQETGLKVLTDSDCGIFNSSTLVFRAGHEVCAANKIPYPQIKVYIRKRKRDGSYTFVYKNTEKNTVSHNV